MVSILSQYGVHIVGHARKVHQNLGQKFSGLAHTRTKVIGPNDERAYGKERQYQAASILAIKCYEIISVAE